METPIAEDVEVLLNAEDINWQEAAGLADVAHIQQKEQHRKEFVVNATKVYLLKSNKLSQRNPIHSPLLSHPQNSFPRNQPGYLLSENVSDGGWSPEDLD